jgi:hypothetical protein
MNSKGRKMEPRDPLAVAEYVAVFTAELALLARGHGLDTLGYILEMARLEAENLSRPETHRRS